MSDRGDFQRRFMQCNALAATRFGVGQMDIGFIAVETFIPPKHPFWSELQQVIEIVSIDCCLCHRIIEYSEDDYKYMIWLGYYWAYTDLDWLLSRTKGIKNKQILAITREPDMDCANLIIDKRFRFFGYDLLEDLTQISALTNCGGFDKAFHPSELSEYGLINDFQKAKMVQRKLDEEYPYEDHADCNLWAIWRMESSLDV